MRWNRSAMASRKSSRKISLRPVAAATASRVKSSSVGPRPPVRITIGTRAIASRIDAVSNSRSSPTIILRRTSTPRELRWSVMKRELVSTRWDVKSSDPTAMISASIKLRELAAFDAYIDAVDGVVGRQNHRLRWCEGDADDGGAGEKQFGFRVGRDADNTAVA